jgi:hypothetical protein
LPLRSRMIMTACRSGSARGGGQHDFQGGSALAARLSAVSEALRPRLFWKR